MTMLRVQEKSPEAFRTISEVAAELDVPQHVLRFWESKFGAVKPLKRGGGRRYYRPDDLDLLRGIRTLLYREGLTIRGVQKILREQGARSITDMGRRVAARVIDTGGGEATEDAAPLSMSVSPAHLFAERRAFEASEDETESDAPAFGLTMGERTRLSELLDVLLSLKARLAAARRVAPVSPY
jgi:DNA-binding transcriptional MerR regulator